MKKIILILASLFFISCTRTVYVNKDTNEVIEIKKHKVTDFINLQRIDDNFTTSNYVFVDTYTDVLYVSYHSRMSAIMKADGTCLTYQEWKERNK